MSPPFFLVVFDIVLLTLRTHLTFFFLLPTFVSYFSSFPLVHSTFRLHLILLIQVLVLILDLIFSALRLRLPLSFFFFGLDFLFLSDTFFETCTFYFFSLRYVHGLRYVLIFLVPVFLWGDFDERDGDEEYDGDKERDPFLPPLLLKGIRGKGLVLLDL